MISTISPIALVELGIVDRLVTVPRPYVGLTVESYAAQLDDQLYAWIRTLPATWVTFVSVDEVKRRGRNGFIYRASFEVLVAQRSLDENAGRLNSPSKGADVGVYALLEDNKKALVNQKLGLPIQPLTPGAIRAVVKTMINHEGVVVYGQQFHTEWMEVEEEQSATPDGELQTIALNLWQKPLHTPPGDAPDQSNVITTT